MQDPLRRRRSQVWQAIPRPRKIWARDPEWIRPRIMRPSSPSSGRGAPLAHVAPSGGLVAPSPDPPSLVVGPATGPAPCLLQPATGRRPRASSPAGEPALSRDRRACVAWSLLGIAAGFSCCTCWRHGIPGGSAAVCCVRRWHGIPGGSDSLCSSCLWMFCARSCRTTCTYDGDMQTRSYSQGCATYGRHH